MRCSEFKYEFLSKSVILSSSCFNIEFSFSDDSSTIFKSHNSPSFSASDASTKLSMKLTNFNLSPSEGMGYEESKRHDGEERWG